MRNYTLLDTESTIAKLNNMRGYPLTVKVNRGRNKIETVDGVIENTYPNVFTVRLQDGGLNTFTYADVMARNILFYKRKI
ncbi:MAG: Veg family protein [Firmicutes bacterium]|uniref:Veg family protein n=1 Tax=Candidatus Stercoripulliclostridium pullicola TaxID=2840953 RepID=A0A940DGT2_9FIRM|nr:Veg family protein [Candidatus Stercoripulliclostridium pullicola]